MKMRFVCSFKGHDDDMDGKVEERGKQMSIDRQKGGTLLQCPVYHVQRTLDLDNLKFVRNADQVDYEDKDRRGAGFS